METGVMVLVVVTAMGQEMDAAMVMVTRKVVEMVTVMVMVIVMVIVMVMVMVTGMVMM